MHTLLLALCFGVDCAVRAMVGHYRTAQCSAVLYLLWEQCSAVACATVSFCGSWKPGHNPLFIQYLEWYCECELHVWTVRIQAQEAKACCLKYMPASRAIAFFTAAPVRRIDALDPSHAGQQNELP
jgi:hypothetical protein